MFRLIGAEPLADQVRRITFVPFLTDGRCVLAERADGPALPSGEVLLDSVPRQRRADLIRHHLAGTVRLGSGRLLVSHYGADPSVGDPAAPGALRSLGFQPSGQSSGGDRPGRPLAPTAWLSAPG